MSSLDGPDITGGALNARAVVGTGPVAEVEHEAFLLGFDEVIASDGAIGVEKLVGNVSHDGGAAGETRPLVMRIRSRVRNLLMSRLELNWESSGRSSAERSSESFWIGTGKPAGAINCEWRRQKPE